VRISLLALRIGVQIAVVTGALTAVGCSGSVSTTPIATFGSFTSSAVNGLNVTFNIAPGAPLGTAATVTSSATAPSGVPAPSSVVREPQSLAGAVPFLFVTIELSRPVPASLFISELLTLTNAFSTSANYFVEIDDPSATPPKLTTIAGTIDGNVVTFTNANGSGGAITTLAANHLYVFQFYYVGASPSPSPSPSPAPSPSPGGVVLSSTSLAFTATGAANAQSVSATQANYTGTFTATTTTCGGIATISPAAGTTFSVTPVAAGSCTFTIAGGGGLSATLTIGVTTTSFGGS
jgi:hypothetical protein